jgi:hypothetical protein
VNDLFDRRPSYGVSMNHIDALFSALHGARRFRV